MKPINDQQPASDDQELASVLAGVDQQVSQLPTEPVLAPQPSGLEFEETPGAPSAEDTHPVDAVVGPTASIVEPPAPVATDMNAPSFEQPVAPIAANSELDSIKKDALAELRPLVSKLDLPADEKFDTILLIIRSTDDQSLLGEAHEAAKAINDETKRAQALLEVIKEIDYFGNQHAA